MADTKISALADNGGLADADYLVLVDDTAGTPVTKRVDALDAKNYMAGLDLNEQTGTTYTLVLADQAKIVEMNNASANTLTIPPNASVVFPVGTMITVTQLGAGVTTVALGVGVASVGSPTMTVGAQGESIVLVKRAADVWYVFGGA
ncbi:MAG: hypothetical protein GY701_07050 [Sulfitobacter sp.]|nr:hypothetical protein [Sulfitobacter sp.]